MKKNRPATKLTVLCQTVDACRLEQLLFAETQTLGIRRWTAVRSKLARRPERRSTAWGPVQGQSIELPGGERRFYPEYEDCRRIAASHKIPLQDVLDVAKRAPID
jgi:uncharacterized protein (DUF111 family)